MTAFRFTHFLFMSLCFHGIAQAEQITPVNDTIECPIPTYAQITERKNQESTQAKQQTKNQSNDIIITSEKTSLVKNQQAIFSGGVTLINNTDQLTANELIIDQQSATLSATGDIHFQNTGIDVFAENFSADQLSKQTTLEKATYQLAENPGHGNAGSIEISETGGLNLIDSSFTTCYGERPAWQIKADRIQLLPEEEIGKAYGASFNVYDIPVMYIPYFSYPITDKRKTGFLEPKIGSSSNSGIEIETPFYWNIAENVDATITPHYMSKRGLQVLTEFRYLTGLQSGVIDIEYLNKDDALKNNDDARYLARVQHTGTLSDNFRAYVDFTTISDDNYLADIGSSQYNANDAYLYQLGELSYFSEQWQAGLKLQDFEILGNHTPSYKTIPQVDFNFYQPIANTLAIFDVYSELSRFISDSAEIETANRYHVEAGLTLPYSTPAWYMNSEIRLMQTNYQQTANANNISANINGSIDENISRTLPKLRLHGGVNFERPMYFNSSYTQTLEPQLQYLYVPEKDQSNIGLYDTTLLQDDYDGLFRDRRYSGLDRIAQANQISWGLTTRMLNATNQELFRFSFGQIVYFDDSNIGDDDQAGTTESALAADLFFQINRQWQFSSDIQYDTQNSFTKKSQVNLDYRHSKNNLVQLNHRYTRDVSNSTVEQVSLLTTFEVNKNWNFVGRVTQDIETKHSLETYSGFQYESCCWAVQFAYHRHINSYFDIPGELPENRNEYDSGFSIKFTMSGLTKGGRVKTDEMLNSSIFGYKQPYFLNN